MFETVRFLQDNFNDVDGVIDLIDQHWHTVPKRDAVRKWFSRANIASEWWPVLQYVLEKKNGKPVSLAEYMEAYPDDVFA